MHTAGKWKYSTQTGLVYVDGKGIAKVYGAGSDGASHSDEGESNVRLITAASEMYEMLDRVHKIMYRFKVEGIIDVVDLSNIVRDSAKLLNRIDGEDAAHE